MNTRRSPASATGCWDTSTNPRLLCASPFIDTAPQGPDMIGTEKQGDDIVAILSDIRNQALPDVTVV